MKARILITAGTTHEMIDPVRFISNIATGVLGYELARAAKESGHPTLLISGPTSLMPIPGVPLISVVSAKEMQRAVHREFPKCDVLFMTAAVCDFTPKKVSSSKLRRKRTLTLQLKSTPDILTSLARRRRNQRVVGFCLETENLLENAARKLRKKKLDGIIACFLGRGQYPFGKNGLKVVFLTRDGQRIPFPFQTKKQLARKLLRWVLSKQKRTE